VRASASEKALSLIAQKNPPRNRSSKVCIRSARDHYPSTRPKTRSRPRDGLSRDLNPEKVTLAHGLGRVDGYHRGYHCRRRGKRIERRRPFFLLCVVLLRKVSFVRCRGITTPRPDPRLALDRDRKVCIRSARDHYPSTRPKTRSRPREYIKRPREGDSGTRTWSSRWLPPRLPLPPPWQTHRKTASFFFFVYLYIFFLSCIVLAS